MPFVKQCINIGEEKVFVNIREGDGNDILFIHGLGCSKESFNEAFNSKWFKGYRLIAPDLLGFGESSKPAEFSYGMNDHADILKELLIKLNSNPRVIISHSMGGAIGLLLLNLISSIKYFFCLEGNLIAEDCFVSKKVISEPESDFLQKKYNKNPVKYRCRQLETDPAPDPAAYYRSSVSLVELSESGILLEKYMGLKIVRTYIYGEENKNIKVVKDLAGTDIAEIKGCGHFMMNDNPEQTYNEIEERLSLSNIIY